MTRDDPLPRTLGADLDAQGLRLTTRLLTTLPWAGPLRVFIDRVAELAVCADRFDRVECEGDRAGLRTPTAVRGRTRRDTGSGSVWTRRGSGSQDAAPPTPAPPEQPRPRPPTTHRPSATASPLCPGRALPAPVRSRLRAAVGPAADALRIHDDDPSDALARRQGADAVTIGREVFFRHGRLRPAEPSGFGLLAHEATHVLALLRPGASWRRATGAGTRDEEAEALANERAVTFDSGPGVTLPHTLPVTGRLAPAPAPGVLAPPALAPPPATRPHRAPADRHTDMAATAPPPVDLQALRRHVIDDVMRQLRSEFERGG